jgi:hypothetical protein
MSRPTTATPSFRSDIYSLSVRIYQNEQTRPKIGEIWQKTVLSCPAVADPSALETIFLVVTSQCYNGFGGVSARPLRWASIRGLKESYIVRDSSVA